MYTMCMHPCLLPSTDSPPLRRTVVTTAQAYPRTYAKALSSGPLCKRKVQNLTTPYDARVVGHGAMPAPSVGYQGCKRAKVTQRHGR